MFSDRTDRLASLQSWNTVHSMSYCVLRCGCPMLNFNEALANVDHVQPSGKEFFSVSDVASISEISGHIIGQSVVSAGLCVGIRLPFSSNASDYIQFFYCCL